MYVKKALTILETSYSRFFNTQSILVIVLIFLQKVKRYKNLAYEGVMRKCSFLEMAARIVTSSPRNGTVKNHHFY